MQKYPSFSLFFFLTLWFFASAIATSKSTASDGIQSLELSLKGVVAFEDKPRAMISMAGMEDEVLVGEGDLIEGYTVRRIERNQMQLAKDGHTETVILESLQQPKPAESVKKIYAEAEKSTESPAPVKRLVSTRSLKRVLSTTAKSETKVALSSSGRPRFNRPVSSGYVSSSYGYRVHPTLHKRSGGTYSMHRGTDIAAPPGTPVHAAANGVVKVSGWTWAKGNYIEVGHSGGYTTAYFHLSKRNVKAGQSVSSGQNIGAVGSTGVSSGPHLHFEIHINGTAVNPATYVRTLNSR